MFQSKKLLSETSFVGAAPVNFQESVFFPRDV
jgi:hypothetical protein